MPRPHICGFEPDDVDLAPAAADDGPEERSADRLVEAIGLGNRRCITTSLADNARFFPRGAWRGRAVIAALYRTSDDILAEVLAAGGDPDAHCPDGCALEIAAQLDAAGKVRLLLAAGAVPPRRDETRREIAVTYRAGIVPEELVIELDVVPQGGGRLARELPLTMSAVLGPLVAVAAAGGLGGDRFDPTQAVAQVSAATRRAPLPVAGRHSLRWQLRVAGLAPSGLAVILASLVEPLRNARVIGLTARGTTGPDGSPDSLFLAGPEAAGRLAARARELCPWPDPPFALSDEVAVRPEVDITLGAAPTARTRAALGELLRSWNLALPVLSRGAGEQRSRLALVQGAGATSTRLRWFLAGETGFPRDTARAVLIGLLSAAAARGADLRHVRLALPSDA